MNEPTEYRDPLQWPGTLNINKLSPEKRLEIDGIRRAEDDIAGGFIKLGGHLCRLKELCEHGEFEALAAMYCRLGERQRQSAMQVYREFGENRTAVRFSAKALIELTRADDPQAALEEAEARKEAGEEVTAKVAREIAAAQKAQQEAEAKAEAVQLKLVEAERRADAAEAQTKPDQSRLIKELILKRRGGGISEAEAEALSLLPEHLQRAHLERLRRYDEMRAAKEKAENSAGRAAYDLREAVAETQAARAEAEEARRRADEIAREGAQAVIDDLRAELEATKKQAERERRDAYANGLSHGAEDKEAEYRERVAALEREKDSLARKLKDERERGDILLEGERRERQRADAAEELLEGASPLALDARHARHIRALAEDLKAILAKLENDCDRHERRESDEAVGRLQATLNRYFTGQEVIDVTPA